MSVNYLIPNNLPAPDWQNFTPTYEAGYNYVLKTAASGPLSEPAPVKRFMFLLLSSV
jgi:hypothetical protein